MDVGLARVSSLDQNPQLQLDALERAGCWPIYSERVSGKAGMARPVRDQVLKELSAGDTLTVWKLDRLGRSLVELQAIVSGLEHRGIKFRSLTEHVDTSTAQGRLFFQLLAAFAEFERTLIVERTLAGKAQRTAAGLHPGGHRMYGLSKDRETEIPHEANRLRQAAEHVLGGKSLGRLIDEWNREGVPTKSGKGRWSETMVRRMLVNERVAPILGTDTHRSLVQLFAPAGERKRLGAPAAHLLSGILQCALCEQPMYWAIDKRRQVYRCRATFGGRWQGCGKVQVSQASADRWILDAIIGAVCNEEFTQTLNERRAMLLEGDVTAAEVDAWRAEIAELEQVLGTRFGTDAHQSRRDELQRLVRRATSQLLQRPDLQALLDLPKTEEAFREAWKSWDETARRRRVKLLLKRVVVKPVGGTGRRFNGKRLDPDWRL